MNPKVSVCSQIHNQTAWAKEMIQSVVDQSLTYWELIIVDDGSTEDLKSVVEYFNDSRIKYIRCDQKKGIPLGLNHAFKEAQGQYVCMIAADEIFHKDKLRVQSEYLDANQNLGACWGLPGSGNMPGEWPLGPRPEWEQYALRAHNRSRQAWLRTLLKAPGEPGTPVTCWAPAGPAQRTLAAARTLPTTAQVRALLLGADSGDSMKNSLLKIS